MDVATFIGHVTLAQILVAAALPVENAENYRNYESREIKDTFGVWHHSLIPAHRLVWPSVEWTVDDDGIPALSRLILQLGRNSSQRLVVPLRPVDDPIQGAQSGRKCHYQSLADGPNDTVHAAISNCDEQLRGTIITATEVFTLHPLPPKRQKSHDEEKGSEVSNTYKTHVLIKRESLSPVEADRRETFCGLGANRPVTKFARDAPLIESTGPTARRISMESGLTVEIAVFVDYEMWKKYWSKYGSDADNQLRDFVSTVFNNIQILYLHPTMSYKVAFKISRYEVFKTQPDSLAGYRHRNGDAQMYLDAFCMYQYGMAGRSWDQSFLFTGYDIHRSYGSDKSISGIARLYGACDPYNSCVLVEGHDFTSVYIATHEIGHGFGMRHDEPYCSSTFIMSGSLGPGKVTWSSCSMNDMGKYIYKLDNNGKNCLRSTSAYVALSTDMTSLPGQKYDADRQCAMMHGSGYRHVIPRNQYSEGACSMMWCGQEKFGRIITAHPALEGTICGNQRYCLRGQCIQRESGPAAPSPAPATPAPRGMDGGWTGWSRTKCSPCNCAPFTGGVAVVQSTRTCTNPTPSKGGRNCAGDAVRGIVCNANCPATGDTADNYIGRYCAWRRSQGNDPELTGRGSQVFTYATRACKVFCDIRSAITGAKSMRFYGDLLPDGTPCGRGQYCANGQCMTLSCSNSAVVGDQSSCPSYYETCPSQASSFHISPTQSVVSTSSVALPEWPQWSAWSVCSVSCGHGQAYRTRQCPSNVKCDYERDTVQTRDCHMPQCPTSEWTVWSPWSRCSSSCNKGVQSRYRYCHGGSDCIGQSEERRQCDNAPCGDGLRVSEEPRWSLWSDWSQCSVTCGEGVRTRTRTCSGHCSTNSLESSWERYPCSAAPCGEWGEWGAWSHCYGAPSVQTRLRNCYGSGTCPGQLDASALDRHHRSCVTSEATAQWLPWSSWSACSSSCGVGFRLRVRACPVSGEGACGSDDRTEKQACDDQQCAPGREFDSAFSARMSRGK